MQVQCRWEGGPLVAITLEAERTSFGHYGYGGSTYYDITVTRSGVWMLLDERKPVLRIQTVGARNPTTVVWSTDFVGGRCWR